MNRFKQYPEERQALNARVFIYEEERRKFKEEQEKSTETFVYTNKERLVDFIPEINAVKMQLKVLFLCSPAFLCLTHGLCSQHHEDQQRLEEALQRIAHIKAEKEESAMRRSHEMAERINEAAVRKRVILHDKPMLERRQMYWLFFSVAFSRMREWASLAEVSTSSLIVR